MILQSPANHGSNAAGGSTATGFLLHCLRFQSGIVGDEGPPPQTDSDWDQFLFAAERHGLAPLLHDRWRTAAPAGSVPLRVQEALHLSFLKHTARNAMLYGELRRIAPALSTAGIPVIVLKGGHLAVDAYEHMGHRAMNDLDLLVPPQQLVAATQLVQKLGFEFLGPRKFSESPLNSADWQSKAASHHESRLHKPPGTGVELHWNLVDPGTGVTVDLEGLWHRSRTVRSGNLMVGSLAPEDLLLHVCLHATRGHRNVLAMGLRPCCDIAALVRRYGSELDWTGIVRRAREWRVARGVGVILAMTVDLLGAPMPESCLEALGSVHFDARRRTLARRIIEARGEIAASAEPAGVWLPEMGRLITRRSVQGWSGALRRVFPFRARWPETRAFRLGAPYSPRNHGLHVLGKVKDLVRVLGFGIRRPSHSWRSLRIFREEARFAAWVQQAEAGPRDPEPVARGRGSLSRLPWPAARIPRERQPIPSVK